MLILVLGGWGIDQISSLVLTIPIQNEYSHLFLIHFLENRKNSGIKTGFIFCKNPPSKQIIVLTIKLSHKKDEYLILNLEYFLLFYLQVIMI